MFKGSPVVVVRIPPQLLQEIDQVVLRLQTRCHAEAPTRSSFILGCVRIQLKKMERSRTWRRKKSTGPG